MAALRPDPQGQGTASPRIFDDASRAHPVYVFCISPPDRRLTARIVRSASDCRWLRNDPTRGLEPAAARADEAKSPDVSRSRLARGCLQSRMRRPRRTSERRVGRAAGQGSSARRRNSRTERMPRRGGRRRGSHNHGISIRPVMRYLGDLLGGTRDDVMSNRATLEDEVTNCDLVIGTVLVAGARTPRLISAKMVARMRPGCGNRRFVDRPRAGSRRRRNRRRMTPTFVRNGVVHYCVTNMPRDGGRTPRPTR